MAEHPTKLGRLVAGFSANKPPGQSIVASRAQAQRAIKATSLAVESLVAGRGISSRQAVEVLRQTARGLTAARKRLTALAKSSGGAPTTVQRLTKSLGAGRNTPISSGIASFVATSELKSPTTKIKVFATPKALQRNLLGIRR